MNSNKDKKKENISILILLIKLWNNLRIRRKKQLYFLFFLSILSGLTELFSLAAVIPFLSVITNPDLIFEINFIKNISKFFKISTSQEILLPITLIFIFSIFIASLIRQLNLWFTQRVAASIGCDISSRSYRNALNQDYQSHILQNSSKIISTTIIQVDTTVSFIISALFAISSAVITIFTFTGLLLINWRIAILSFSIFGSIYILLSKFIKLKLSKNSLTIAHANKMQQKSLQEGLGAIRNIILDNLQNIYTNLYFKEDQQLRRATAEANYLRIFPRYLLESFGLILISLFAFLVSSKNTNTSSIITILGTFALGSQRLLPALQQVYSSWAGMGAQIYAVKNVVELIEKKESSSNDNFKFLKLKSSFEIKFDSISFEYKNSGKETLKDIDLSIKSGDRIGIIGETGSGKSTLLDLFMGLLKPSSGKLLINNIDINKQENYNFLKSYQSQISHVPQDIYLSDSSIAENIAFGIPNSEIILNRVKKAAKEARIDNFINNLPDGYNTYVGERGVRLSGGQKQRIAIARALYKKSRIIFFDEATSALDEETEKDLINSLYKLKKDLTLIMIAHRLSSLSFCEKIIEVKNKKIYFKDNLK